MLKKKSVAVILPAGGMGTRLGHSTPKAFIRVAGKTILEHTIDRFRTVEAVSRIIVAVPQGMVDEAKACLDKDVGIPVEFTEGGKERLYSIRNALQLIKDEPLTAVHDAVRPYIQTEDIIRVFSAAAEHDAAMLVSPSDNTLKRVSESMHILETLDRSEIWQAQTPQVFKTSLLRHAYQAAIADSYFGTDDASLVERTGARVIAVKATGNNAKITRKPDLQQFINSFMSKNSFRIGYGYDTHRLKEGRKLILGGVEIPHTAGLDGHSDADVLIHAIIDAMIGALALGDIGSHFPDTDKAFKDADSRVLLRKVMALVHKKGYVTGNVDSTIVAERPRMRSIIDEMRRNIAVDLETEIENISVKATTSEKIGFAGREEGMSCSAVVLLFPKPQGDTAQD